MGASFGSNQTEEKEDHSFYNKQKRKMKQLNTKNIIKQPIEVAIFPEDDEGVETIQIINHKQPQNYPNLSRDSVKMNLTPSPTLHSVSSSKPEEYNKVRERKSLHMTPSGYMDEKYDKLFSKKNKKLDNKQQENIGSPSQLNPPPNSLIQSPSSNISSQITTIKSPKIIISHYGDDDDDDDDIINKILENKQNKNNENNNNNNTKRASVSHKSGRSFVTLFDEKKDIEADDSDEFNDDLDDDLEDVDSDQFNDNNLQNEDDKDLDDDDLDNYDLDESNTEELSKQLFGRHSLSLKTPSHQLPSNENQRDQTQSLSSFHHTLQSQTITKRHHNLSNHFMKPTAITTNNNDTKNTSNFLTKQFSTSFDISEMSPLQQQV